MLAHSAEKGFGMEHAVGRGRVRLKLYGTRTLRDDDGPLSAVVFGRKLLNLISALGAADRAANRRRTYDYVIVRMREGSGLIEVEERPIRNASFRGFVSAVEAFAYCTVAVSTGNHRGAREWGHCVDHLVKLSTGADTQFGFGELWINGRETPFRVDAFLEEQGRAVIDVPTLADVSKTRQWFKGSAQGTFVGDLLEVDFRGVLPLGKLILSAGGKEIDCVFRQEDVDKVRASTKERVRLSGLARYDGKMGIPRRIEVRNIVPTKKDVDFSKWHGSFSPFEKTEWVERDDWESH